LVFSKFTQRSQAPGSFQPGVIAPRKEVKYRKPVGRGMVVLVSFLALVAGGIAAWELVRVSMRGSDIQKVLTAALLPTKYVRAMLTSDMVFQKIAEESVRQQIDLPRDRVWLKIDAENTPTGEFVVVTAKVFIPNKMLGFIKYPIYKAVETRIRASGLPQGFSRFETSPSSDIAQEIAAHRKE
jgi:hypothetical protein